MTRSYCCVLKMNFIIIRYSRIVIFQEDNRLNQLFLLIKYRSKQPRPAFHLLVTVGFASKGSWMPCSQMGTKNAA